MEEIENTLQEENKLPPFLKILCILTFISAGLGGLLSLLMPMIGDKLVALMESAPNFDLEANQESITVLQAGWGYYLLTFAITMASLTGALFMWKRKKVGFHIYVAASVVGFLLPILILNISFSFVGAFFSLLFIVLYTVNFKHLN